MIRMTVAFTALLTATAAVAAQAYPTIVGEWFQLEHGPADCGTPRSTAIKSMEVRTGETLCTFDRVVRDQWMVRWDGECSEANDTFPMVITATEDSSTGILAMSFSTGSTINDLKRCPKR